MPALRTEDRPTPSSGYSHDLVTRAAWLSYVGGYTQAEIAGRLNISQAKAHRLITQAHHRKLVKIFIEGKPAECIALEEMILERFGLQNCVVAPAMGGQDSAGDFESVGAAAAHLFMDMLDKLAPDLIGVGKGRSLVAMVDHLPRVARPELKIVPVSGSLTRKLAVNPFDVVFRLVDLTGGEGYFLPVPYIAASPSERDVFKSQKSVNDVLELAHKAGLHFIGIGGLDARAHILETGMLDAHDLDALHAAGAVGDMMGSFIDIQGQPVNSPLNDQALGLGIDDLRDRRVCAVLAGTDKAKALLGALRTGTLSDLVTCEITARDLKLLLEAGQ